MYILNTKKGCMFGTTPITCFEDDVLVKSQWVENKDLPKDFYKKPSAFSLINGKFVPRDMTLEKLTTEKEQLQAFVNSADYITIKLCRASLQGVALLDEYSDTFKMTNREVLQEVDKAILRINEINVLLENTT